MTQSTTRPGVTNPGAGSSTAQGTDTKWIAYRRLRPSARMRLFCFHYAGGAASVYRTWQESLPADVEVCAVQLPGRESRLREPRLTRVAPILEELQEALPPFFDLPFAFFGHSMGAILAFELTLALRRAGGPLPQHLMLSGRRAPHRPDPDPDIHALPEEEFKQELRGLNGTPEEVLAHPELMELLIPVLRADFAVCETYEHASQEPLQVPVSAFGGIGDHKVSREDLEGWQRYTKGEFRLRMFQGDHFYLSGPARGDLLRSVARELAGHLDALPA